MQEVNNKVKFELKRLAPNGFYSNLWQGSDVANSSSSDLTLLWVRVLHDTHHRKLMSILQNIDEVAPDARFSAINIISRYDSGGRKSCKPKWNWQ